MWHSSRRSGCVTISRDCVTLFRREHVDGGHHPTRSEPLTDVASLAGALERCVGAETRALRMIVSDVYARFWITQPPANATTKQDLRMSSLWRFEELFGEPASSWNLQADWHAGRPFVACAIPLAITDVIAAVTSAMRIHVINCVPRFVAEWNVHRRALRSCNDAWFGVFADSIMTLALVRRGEIAQIQRVPCPKNDLLDLDIVSTALRSMALQAHDCRLGRVVLCGDLPAQWEGARSGEFQFERIEVNPRPAEAIALDTVGLAEQTQ